MQEVQEGPRHPEVEADQRFPAPPPFAGQRPQESRKWRAPGIIPGSVVDSSICKSSPKAGWAASELTPVIVQILLCISSEPESAIGG